MSLTNIIRIIRTWPYEACKPAFRLLPSVSVCSFQTYDIDLVSTTVHAARFLYDADVGKTLNRSACTAENSPIILLSGIITDWSQVSCCKYWLHSLDLTLLSDSDICGPKWWRLMSQEFPTVSRILPLKYRSRCFQCYSYSRVNNGLVTLGVSGQQPKARTGRYGPRDEVAATLSRLWPLMMSRWKLQALGYDILPSTTAVFSYVIGSWKLSANEQFFVGTQIEVSLLQTTHIKQGGSFTADKKVDTSTNKNNNNRLNRAGNLSLFFSLFFTRGGCVSCLYGCLGARLLPQSLVPKRFGGGRWPSRWTAAEIKSAPSVA